MDPQEHIHIISAGESIHAACPAVLDNLRNVTHMFIFAENDIYTSSVRDTAQKRGWKCSIRNAIDATNAVCMSRNISCNLVCIDPATFDAIRDPVLSILSNHPDARYSFDISAGSKRLSLGLFSMSLWVEGDTYYAYGNSPVRRMPVPTLPTKNLPANPQCLLILTILFRKQKPGSEIWSLVPEETLFNEAKAWQIPVHTPDGVGMRELSRADFSRLMANLVDWNFVRAEVDPGNCLEKVYSITQDGELALFVQSARMKKRGVTPPPGLS